MKNKEFITVKELILHCNYLRGWKKCKIKEKKLHTLIKLN